jgi:murein DD-endopeptidase MepM/ murein hydrolase activator NlpD
MPSPSSPIALPGAISLEPRTQDDPAQVRQLAHEFEGMMLLQMLRQMRQSIAFGKDEESEALSLGDSTMTDTMDAELARQLSLAGGVGMADVIVNAFEKEQSLQRAAAQRQERREPVHTLAPLPARGRWGDAPVPPVVGAPPQPASREGAPPAPVSAPGPAPVGRATPEGSPPGIANAAVPLPTGAHLTSHFGWRADPLDGQARFHSGVDLAAAYGTAVPSAAAGRVVFAGEQAGYGTTVVVEHGPGLETRYAHLSASVVRVGDSVAVGQTLGRVGRTGRSTGPHLHFEVVHDGRRVDPELAAARFAALREFKPLPAGADSPAGGDRGPATEE